jgi:hypothetical protein
MVMQMLEAGGLEVVTDQHRPPDESNPRGYFELERVKALETGDVAWVAEARGKAVKVIAYLLEHLPPNLDYRVIFIIRNLEEVLASQAKMLARQEEGVDAGERTDTGDSADAGAPTDTRTLADAGALSDAGGSPDPGDQRMREIFYRHLAQARRLLAREPRFDVLYLRHDEVLRDPETAATHLASFIAGGLDIQAMAAVVDPALHRERTGE